MNFLPFKSQESKIKKTGQKLKKKKGLLYEPEERVKFFYKGLSQIHDLLIGAFTFIAALAWNDAISNYISKYSVFKKYGQFAYAITITILAVVVVVMFSHYLHKIQIGSLTESDPYKNIRVAPGEYTDLADLNHDGALDLTVSGGPSGRIYYYKNIGSSIKPIFKLQSSKPPYESSVRDPKVPVEEDLDYDDLIRRGKSEQEEEMIDLEENYNQQKKKKNLIKKKKKKKI